MKGVFDTRGDTRYDDDVERRYHFPNRYLEHAKQTVGDWIVYREPRRGQGRQGYVAVARVTAIEPDENDGRYWYALVADYLPLDGVVPLNQGNRFFEHFLNGIDDRSRIGAAMQGRSIRTISDAEFCNIVQAGLNETLDPQQSRRLGLDVGSLSVDVTAFLNAPGGEQQRRIVEMLSSRTIRDAAFRRTVLNAYKDTCAVTGLRIINGGGRPEAQAAHIWPVADGGPDTVHNGLALSATCHWLFDRHLISLTPDYRLLVAHNKVPPEFRSLFVRNDEQIHLPDDRANWPHPAYVERHREKFATA